MKRKWLPDNVTAYKDRHGKTRYRYRKAGLPTYSFRSEPGTPEFLAELARAKSATPPEPSPRFERGTVDYVIEALYRSVQWKEMRPSSRATFRGILERFRKDNGHRQISTITTERIDRKMASMKDTPSAANNLRKALSILFRRAIKLGLIDHNPATFADSFRQRGEGFHTWSESEIAKFERRWPYGTRERAAMAIMLHTALRKSDAVRVGDANRIGDELHLLHSKNDSATIIPINADLQAAIAPFEGQGIYLQTSFGKPFTVNGFGNWFREACNAAGLPHCTAHGLRKAMARRLAESGATNLQGRSVTGHATDKEFEHYAKKANRRDMASAALANVADRFAKKGGDNV